MSKKVLILSSSPRRGGNSDRLCDEFLRGAQQAGHRAEKVFLADLTLNYCTGCGACSERGLGCPERDDAAGIVERMIDADVIVLATPVYFYTLCARMKTLLDRCCARYLEIRNKEFYYILAAAETDRRMMERTVECFRGFLDCLENAQEKGVIYGTGAWKMHEIENKPALREAYEAGLNC
ncbi:flavodoxin family protein [Alistipes sp.]|uniref:flavodoxin family protein n=1 Tax=Alistipes sp. TaxID=1872444 RepID=UPI003AF17E31